MKTLSLFTLAVLSILLSSCTDEAAFEKPDVTIYCALDQVFSEPLITEFEKETGLHVRANYDVEAVKTVGLVTTIIEERDNPKCDVFWNNELVHTVRLKKQGLLAPYKSPSAADIPAEWKDPDGYWTGLAARARVLILHVPTLEGLEPDRSKWPSRSRDFIDDKWKGKSVMAKPLAGTTLTHMAVLWDQRGGEWVKQFWERLYANDIRIATGNAHVMKEVSAGKFAFGYTDTDDFRKAANAGEPVEMVYPDQGEGDDGCLVIPNSVCLIKNGPNPENAKKLIDFILRKETEARLAAGPSAQIPVRASVPRPAHVKSAEDLKTMTVDWQKVGDAVEPTSRFLSEVLSR